MDIKNLKRAAEIHEMMNACISVRNALSKDKPFTINGIELPPEMASNILQVINLNINQLRDEVKTL